MVSYGSCRVDKEIKLRARAEGLAVMKFFNYGQVGRGFSLDIPFHRTLIEDEVVAAHVVRENNTTRMGPIKKIKFMVQTKSRDSDWLKK